MHIQFTAVRRGVKIVPAYDARTDLPQALMQSAIVVGPKGEEVYCDQMGRVKIRFPGTRAADHKHADGSGAAGDDGDSAWVRVASNWAGNGPGSVDQCGTVGLPRVGTEVLVNFLGGDPDKPVIVGQLYNQQAQPPALSNLDDLPGNRYLSGIKSREIKGGRANQLRLDDTKGQISAQLSSDHANSQVNLGFLTESKTHGHGKPRGEGAELRSDMQATVRGGQGVLITAEATDVDTGAHLERNGLSSVLLSLEKLVQELSQEATKHANDKTHGPELTALVEKLKKMDTNGAPIVAISAPAGLVAGSKQNIAIGADKTIDIVSLGATCLSSGETTSLRAAQGMSLFANEGGLKATAASGQVMIKANDDQMMLLAKKVLEIISTADWITIKAKKGVRINGGGTELELSASGIKGYTDGKHEVYAKDHQTFAAKARPTEFSADPQLHKICIPCLLIAAEAHSPFAISK